MVGLLSAWVECSGASFTGVLLRPELCPGWLKGSLEGPGGHCRPGRKHHNSAVCGRDSVWGKHSRSQWKQTHTDTQRYVQINTPTQSCTVARAAHMNINTNRGTSDRREDGKMSAVFNRSKPDTFFNVLVQLQQIWREYKSLFGSALQAYQSLFFCFVFCSRSILHIFLTFAALSSSSWRLNNLPWKSDL